MGASKNCYLFIYIRNNRMINSALKIVGMHSCVIVRHQDVGCQKDWSRHCAGLSILYSVTDLHTTCSLFLGLFSIEYKVPIKWSTADVRGNKLRLACLCLEHTPCRLHFQTQQTRIVVYSNLPAADNCSINRWTTTCC